MLYLDDSFMQLWEVAKVSTLGYRISYEFNEHAPFLYMSVWLARQPVAQACFRFDKGTATQFTETIEVYDGHRRKGIANSLMVCAMRLTGCKPKPAANQSADGRAWWAQRNRPW
jgi:hypothetical protein